MKLRITDDVIDTIGSLHRVCAIIAQRDSDLAKQIRRATNSLGLNSGEGLHAAAGNRTVRLESAMTSGREAIFGRRIAGAAGYLEASRARGR